MIRTFKNKRMTGANELLGEGGHDPCSANREIRGVRGISGGSAPPSCAIGQMRRCGVPPAMKAGEPDPHTNPARAMARRASTGEKGLSQCTQA